MKITDYISWFKVRFDRGSVYWRYINAIVTAALVTVFTSEISIWYKIVSAIASFIFILVLGIIDIKVGILRKEQKIYGDQHPTFVEINKKLDKILNQLIL